MKTALHIVFGRFARNIYFWVFVLYLRFKTFKIEYSTSETGQLLLLMTLLLGLIYINNLLLIPRLLAAKKRWPYFPAITVLLFVYSYVSSGIALYWYHHQPKFILSKVIWFIYSSNEEMSLEALCVNSFMNAMVLVFLFSLCWYANDHKRRSDELIHSQAVQTETELIFLKNQLNPQFLFNTLNNLYDLSIKESDSAPELILKLSSILRYLLYESNVPLVSFEKEKEIMSAYIDLELLRLHKEACFDVVLYSDQEDHRIPPLLWLPVLENVFRYGHYFTANAPAEFQCSIVENRMQVYSKIHMDSNEISSPEFDKLHLGLEHLRKRLQLLYPSGYNIDVSCKEKFAIVNVEIQLAT